MVGRTLMIQGTSSSSGKSLITAALCRLLARRGVRVAPFKAQNMSNNSAVCDDGAEIGRSQALQARAAGVAPCSDMNPILLKPEAETRSQVIVNGRVWKTLSPRAYFDCKQELWPVVTAALGRLRAKYDVVVIEGAGSPAELNFHGIEIVNMAVARHAQAPVLLVGDIERGGVFAQLLGTLWLLPPADQRLVRGLVVNKFRGDRSLFDSGRSLLAERGGVPVLGVIPWSAGLDLPEEDSATLDRQPWREADSESLEIAVIRFPHVSNFDDVAPLLSAPGVRVRYVISGDRLGNPDAVILPGTKSTVADFLWLLQTGLAERIIALAGRGAQIAGICGGFQMQGRTILDPQRIESESGSIEGLGLLPITTEFRSPKQTSQMRGQVTNDSHCPGAAGSLIQGYEIHLGRSCGGTPWLRLERPGAEPRAGGAVSDDGRVWGCYVHGLFGNDQFRTRWLKNLRGQHRELVARSESAESPGSIYEDQIEQSLDRFADTVEQSLDMAAIENLIWPERKTKHV